jgi:hypothetical protein
MGLLRFLVMAKMSRGALMSLASPASAVEVGGTAISASCLLRDQDNETEEGSGNMEDLHPTHSQVCPWGPGGVLEGNPVC